LGHITSLAPTFPKPRNFLPRRYPLDWRNINILRLTPDASESIFRGAMGDRQIYDIVPIEAKCGLSRESLRILQHLPYFHPSVDFLTITICTKYRARQVICRYLFWAGISMTLFEEYLICDRKNLTLFVHWLIP